MKEDNTVKTWYVELSKTVYHTGEVKAATQEEAENLVLAEANGDPRDWKIVKSEEAVHLATYNR